MDAAAGLIPFTELTFPRYQTARHHRIIAGQLERVERGEIDRLMLLCPPRSGKSELASKRFPAFYLGRQPHRQFLSVSATGDLASDFGREVRNIIASADYRSVFPDVTLAEDSQAKGKWHTSSGGVYYSVGIDGGVMGRGGDVILIDDPYASMKDAMSETTRKNVWSWYTGTAYNRLQPGGSIVIINHRMHEDDLSGRLLAQQAAGGDRWEVVELPAINDCGEALWPEAFPIETLERIRSNTMPRDWSALYQQRPAPEEGDYFKADWLRPYVTAPARDTMRVYGGSDYAVTADGGDYTVHAVVGIDREGRLYLLDLWRAQAASDRWIEAFCDLVIKWKPIGWAEEQGQIKAGIGPFLDRRQRERRAWVARQAFPTRGDKAVRAQSIRGRMALSGLYVPEHAPWYPDFRAELLSFPAGKHDDQCLAEGTLITMSNGVNKPIECVGVGEYVATPIGPCEVLASEITSESAKVFRVSAASGRKLIATGNHPIHVLGRGFCRVDTLRMGDQITTYGECAKDHQRLKSSSIAVTDTGDIQTARTKRTSDISSPPSRAADFFIGTCGRMLSEQFRRATTFTIKMAIGTTIVSRISSVLLRKNTSADIRLLLNVWLNNLFIYPGFATRRQPGIEAMQGGLGIRSMALLLGQGGRGLPEFALPVGRNSMRFLTALCSVPAGANSAGSAAVRRNMEDLLPRANRSIASAAIDYSLQNGQIAQHIVPKHAECVIAVEELLVQARVRNLTVSRAHAYYANGILCHNCDSIGLIGQLLDKMMPPGKPEPAKPKNESGYAVRQTGGRPDDWMVF